MVDVSQKAGYAVFHTQITIANGQTVSDIADLERSYAFIAIASADLAGVDTNATMTAQIGLQESTALFDLYEVNDPTTIWSKDPPLTGTMYFILSHAMGARFIQLTLDVITTADVTFDIFGIDQATESLMS